MTDSLSALIAQVQARDNDFETGKVGSGKWAYLEFLAKQADAAPVLAAALKDALDILEAIVEESDPHNPDFGGFANQVARSFLVRHQEKETH